MKSIDRANSDHYQAIYDQIFDLGGFIKDRKTYNIARCCGLFYYSREKLIGAAAHASEGTFSKDHSISGYSHPASFDEFLAMAKEEEALFVQENKFPIRFELATGKESEHQRNLYRVETFRLRARVNKLEKDLKEAKEAVVQLEESSAMAHLEKVKLRERIAALERGWSAQVETEKEKNELFIANINKMLQAQYKKESVQKHPSHLGKHFSSWLDH